MDGIDHYKRAEEIAQRIADGKVSDYDKQTYATLAQVHATLALTAAQANATEFRKRLARANGMDLDAKPKAAPKPVNLLDDEDV
jgi:phage terminase Nu1 subunit (DNA packaging protein)